MATIQDVAAAAGVSVATVSRVLNKSEAVAQKSIDKVNKAISDLSYTPNALARDLRRAESRHILVLLQTISNPFYASIVKGIEDVAHSHQYSIMLCNTDSDANRENEYIELLDKKVVSGAILLDTAMDIDAIKELDQCNHIVLCCECRQGIGVTHIKIDNYAAAKTITNHLIALGHKDIGLIVGDMDLSSTQLRYNGYLDALSEGGIPFRESLVYHSEKSSYKDGMRAVEKFLNGPRRPTAIFAMSDVLAIGAIKSISNKGLKVPDDIAVAGFDGIDISEVMVPGLTTIYQPTYDIGCIAMKMLLDKMKNGDKEKHEVLLEHSLIIRESTIKPAV